MTTIPHPHRSLIHWFLLAIGLLLSAGLLRASEANARTINLPADRIENSVRRIATTFGVDIVYATDIAGDTKTRAVAGTMTAIEAVTRMLEGSGLVAVQDAAGAIKINRGPAPEKNGASRPAVAEAASSLGNAEAGVVTGRVVDASTGAYLPGAEVRLGGIHATSTGPDGSFVFRGVGAGTHLLEVDYIGYNTVRLNLPLESGRGATVRAALSPAVIDLAAFIVEGPRAGQARAINEQRSAINVKNVVAADAIGNFPDVNAAEALKRIPGISTVRQRGEDRDITIRGAAPNLNSITLDGVSVLSNQQNGRTVSMDVYPAEQLAGIEITKSALPSMDGDSIGGAINLRSKSAFDADRRLISLNTYIQYNDLADQYGYRAGFSYSDILGADDQWGVQLTLSTAQRHALEQTAEPAGWALRSGAANNGNYTGYGPNNLPFTYVDIERERSGASLTLERKVGTDTVLFLRSSYNEFIERNARPRYVIQAGGNNISNTHPVQVENGRIVEFTSTRARGQRVVNPRVFTDTGASVALGGRTVANDWNIELVASFARGTNHQDSVTGQWQTGNATLHYDLSDPERPRVTQLAGPDLNAASSYSLSQLQIQERRLRNIEYAVKGDASREFQMGSVPFKFSTGFKYRWTPKRFDLINTQYNSVASGTFNMDDPRLGGTSEVARGFLDGLMDFGPSIAPYNLFEFAKANRDLFVPNTGASLQNTLSSDYYVKEEITAGYVMGEWTIGRLTALAGARYEHTDTEAKGYRQDSARNTADPARYKWTAAMNDYDNLLPGVHLRYAPTKSLVLRASWNHTLARPETNRISPSVTVNTPGTPSVSDPVLVSGGNPDLKATKSVNYDLSAEYYLKSIGMLSVGYFRKDLSGPIYRRVFDGVYDGQPARFTVFSNAGDAWVSGWEFAYQQQFTFLPAPFDGFGIYANYTVVDSEVELTEPGRVGELLPLFNQSDNLGNLALTYQKYGLFVRLSHNWRSDYLATLSDPGLDEYARGFEGLDLLVSYRLSERWSLKFEASNMTSEPERQYIGASDRSIYMGDTGRSFAFGVHFNF